jgi:hypothetical protein
VGTGELVTTVLVVTDTDREPVAVVDSPETALSWAQRDDDGAALLVMSAYGQGWLIHEQGTHMGDYCYAVNPFPVVSQ